MRCRLIVRLFPLCVLVLAIAVQLPAQDVHLTFQNPPKAYRPMVRWWWPGGDVADAELRREVKLLDQAGFGGVEIQPLNRELNPHMPDEVRKRVNDYLTTTFFSHMQAALEEARSRGMWLDYTFGSGWPFGGAGVITPELASVELRYAHQSIRGPVKFHGKLPIPEMAAVADEGLPPGWAERMKQREKLVAVVAVRGENVDFYPNQLVNQEPRVKQIGQLDPGTSIVLTNRVLPDGTLDWDVPPGTWQVFTFKEMPTGQKVLWGVGPWPELVLDHMSRKAFEAYANRVGGTARQYDGQYFGHGLRAIFCDSLEVSAYLFWSDNFLEEFRVRRGYDLTPYLPILKVQGFGMPDGQGSVGSPPYDIRGIGDRVRRDYWQTVSDVMFDNFYEPLNTWAAKNNLLSRVQAHGSPTDLLRVYGAASIPETEDLYDNGRYDFMKMASSAADLYGRKIVSSETFVWMGKAYQTTPEKMKRHADEMVTAGVNEIVNSGFPYEYMDRSEPGWYPFAGRFSAGKNPFSTYLGQHSPFWPFLSGLNEYITRLQYLSQVGTTSVPVALYRGSLSYDSIGSPGPEPEIDTQLMSTGYNFDHIDGLALLQCKVIDGKLVSPGGTKYGALILPYQRSVPGAVAEQLSVFAKDGLAVLFIGQVPKVEPPIQDGQIATEIIHNPLQEILKYKNVSISSDAAGTLKVLKAEVQPNLKFLSPAVPFIEKRIGKLDIFFLRNPNDTQKRVEASFAATGEPQVWDPWTGAIRSLYQFSRHGNLTQARVDLDPYGSTLLVFNPDAHPAVTSAKLSSTSPTPAQIAVGTGGWTFHGVGIGPGSQPETFDLQLPELVDWTMTDGRLKYFSGRGEYTTHFTVPGNFLGNNRRVLLDLGDVKDVAEITVNDRKGPVLLLRPYRADVTQWIHAGENTLQITVVNTLYNALAARGLSANYSPETTDTPNGLMPSGLIGPVRLEEQQQR